MSAADVRKVTFEVAVLGRSGLDVNDPEKRHTLQSIPGQSFSGLRLVSTMYVGFKRIDPAMDVGFDLSKEYEAALSLHGKGR